MRIAWIGLGTMGAAMASHLVRAGHDVAVHNRTRSREAPLVALGARGAASPADAAQRAEVVFTCVSDSPDVEHVVLGPTGAIHGMAAGAVLADCSTIAPATSRELAARLVERGLGAVDAPVSGGSEGARRGTLTTFVGGEDEHVARTRPALEAFCRSITHLGPAGAGQAGKAVNQVVIAGTYATMGEALALGAREGLPMDALVAALSAGAAQSWVLENRAGNVISDSFPLGFRTSLHLKDLRIALAEADDLGLPMEVTRLIADWEERLVAAGLGDEDVSNLARVAKGQVE